ncbi:ParB/RepB/Spo0J family partition protein [Streptomyces sp. LX-29]|uniref:ParB/RepB/Spo0J family partition protein n=1 Tax=Streptomyces sp. LX-29 TaxID=2900152 RepID=UPI00240D9A83|nr:ParB/RepB/Spo0J family partition protein [Streptomyces sp. LX-29]WFB07413.1 ParB/RepB/Spo0J family partition protein [Streptomyces sp. LX-29]
MDSIRTLIPEGSGAREGERTSLDLATAACADVMIDSLLPADSPRATGLDREYVELLGTLGAELPPIVVHRATGRVIDGMHRVAAARLRGDATISAYLLDLPEARVFATAVSLNISHGKPLTYRDRVAAANRILKENPALSDRYVASVTALSARTVARIRCSTADIPHVNTRVGRDGKRHRDDVAHGRQRAGELLRERPDATLREIARAAGISLGTAHDVKRRILVGRDPVPRARSAPARPPERRLDLPDAQPADSGQLLERLRKDPAVRLSQSGRFLLRCLAVHDIESSVWAKVVAAIPPHCADGVVKLARECADVWTRFADLVESDSRVSRRSTRA